MNGTSTSQSTSNDQFQPASQTLVTPALDPSNRPTVANVTNFSQDGTALQNAATQNKDAVLDKKRLAQLCKEVDPLMQLEEDLEEILVSCLDDFIDSTVSSACNLSTMKKSATLDTKEIQFVLERYHNIWVPGFGNDEIKPPKRPASIEAHKQRMNIIKKAKKS